jgi:hypothetical protein
VRIILLAVQEGLSGPGLSHQVCQRQNLAGPTDNTVNPSAAFNAARPVMGSRKLNYPATPFGALAITRNHTTRGWTDDEILVHG